jgi:hypothetical protein
MSNAEGFTNAQLAKMRYVQQQITSTYNPKIQELEGMGHNPTKLRQAVESVVRDTNQAIQTYMGLAGNLQVRTIDFRRCTSLRSLLLIVCNFPLSH